MKCYSALKKKTDTYYIMGKPWRHHVKEYDSHKKISTICFYLYKVTRVIIFTNTEEEWWLAGTKVEGRENGSYCLMSTEFQLYEMRRDLEVDDDDGCATMWMYLMLLNCIPKNGQNGKFYIIYIYLN